MGGGTDDDRREKYLLSSMFSVLFVTFFQNCNSDIHAVFFDLIVQNEILSEVYIPTYVL
jgi:hypothetical protein